MAQTYGFQANKVFNTSPIVKVPPAAHGGRVRSVTDTVTLASQAVADTIIVGGGNLPLGAQILYGVLTSTVSLGTSTIAIGTATTPGLYRTAGVLTAVDTPTLYGNTASLLTPLTAEQQLVLTIGGATLPSSGTLQFELFYAID